MYSLRNFHYEAPSYKTGPQNVLPINLIPYMSVPPQHMLWRIHQGECGIHHLSVSRNHISVVYLLFTSKTQGQTKNNM